MSKGAALVMAVAVVVVALQSFRVSTENRGLSRQIHSLLGARLVSGDNLSPLVGTDVGGLRREVRFSESESNAPTLVLTASFDCPACQRTFPIWKELSALAANSMIRTVIVIKDAPVESRAQEITSNGLDSLIAIFDPTYATYGQLRMTGVPTTALVSPGGIVLRTWFGALDTGTAAAEVEAYIQTSADGTRGQVPRG